MDSLIEHGLKLEQEAVSVMRMIDRVKMRMKDQVSN